MKRFILLLSLMLLPTGALAEATFTGPGDPAPPRLAVAAGTALELEEHEIDAPAPVPTTSTPLAPLAPLATAAGTALEPATAAPAEPGEIIAGGVKVLNDWRTVGWMAGLVAICNLLMMILKRVPLVSRLFAKAPPWVQPVVVLGVGAVGGFFSGFLTGGLPGALIGVAGGIGAGFSAVGADTTAKRMTAAGAAEVAVIREVKASLAATDAMAEKKSATMAEATATARKIANPGARMKAFAGLLKNGAK